MVFTVNYKNILMGEPKLKIYKSTQRVVDTLAEEFFQFMEKKAKSKEIVYMALSGGTTPQSLFRHLSENYAEKIPWENVHFFWVDERCVSPDDPESNFGMAKNLLFDNIEIPLENVHRIKGENDPETEVDRYADEILKYVPLMFNLPRFDWIWLGMGDDGHVASIFPDQLALIHSDKICAKAIHPVTKQKRVTLTGRALNHTKRASFLVTGAAKAPMVNTILKVPGKNNRFPAFHIKPSEGILEWYLDEEAAIKLR
jgi:6-phosphogluconolactonase